MSRQPRIEFPGAIYHVFARSIEKKKIFQKTTDFEMFLQCLVKMIDFAQVEVLAYALMDNHYHLLIRTPNGNLVRAMHQLQNNFVKAFNRTYSRVGPLFQGRYKSLVVAERRYLKEVVRYIHLNPLRRRLIKKLERYRWCSYRFYAGVAPFPNWMSPEAVLALFGADTEEAIAAHKSYVMAGRNLPEWNPLQVALEGVVCSTRKAFGELLSSVDINIATRELVSRRRMLFEPDDIVEAVCRTETIERATILAPGRQGGMHRQAAMYLSRRHTGRTLSALGAYFGGVTYGCVNTACRKVAHTLEKHPESSLAELCRAIELQLKQGK